MECVAILDACVALSLIDEKTANDADDLLGRVVKMLSKMCQLKNG